MDKANIKLESFKTPFFGNSYSWGHLNSDMISGFGLFHNSWILSVTEIWMNLDVEYTDLMPMFSRTFPDPLFSLPHVKVLELALTNRPGEDTTVPIKRFSNDCIFPSLVELRLLANYACIFEQENFASIIECHPPLRRLGLGYI
jgi:hypothetical protein